MIKKILQISLLLSLVLLSGCVSTGKIPQRHELRPDQIVIDISPEEKRLPRRKPHLTLPIDRDELIKVREKEIPLYSTFVKIANEEYILSKNDCSNKCAKYADALLEAGYEPLIMVVTVYTYDPRSNIYTKHKYNHAIVVLIDRDTGKMLFYDVTNNQHGRNFDDLSSMNFVIRERLQTISYRTIKGWIENGTDEQKREWGFQK